MIRKSSTTAAALALLVGATGCGYPVGPAARDDIEVWMEFYDVPGVSVAVISDFALDYVEFYGVKDRSTLEPVTAQTLFQAASLSKSVSSTGVMTLVQQGRVSLDADIDDYLTSWHLPHNSHQVDEDVTLRRLMSHTAGTTVHGFRGYRYTESVPTLIQILNGVPPANSPAVVVDHEPGSRFSYSGGGYEVMDQAIRDVTGTTFPDFMRERVLEPLGMVNSTYQQPIPGDMFESAASGYYANGVAVPGRHHIYPEIAAAALWTTPTDMARFLTEIQLSLRGQANRVLSRDNTEVLVTEIKDDYGLGFSLRSFEGRPYFWHAGANDGFRGAMVAHRDGHGVVILTNSDNGSELSEAIIELIGKREGWPGY